jgi:transglutaminase-like putative cysteine protease
VASNSSSGSPTLKIVYQDFQPLGFNTGDLPGTWISTEDGFIFKLRRPAGVDLHASIRDPGGDQVPVVVWNEGDLALVELAVPDSRAYEFVVFAKPKSEAFNKYKGVLAYDLPPRAAPPKPGPGTPPNAALAIRPKTVYPSIQSLGFKRGDLPGHWISTEDGFIFKLRKPADVAISGELKARDGDRILATTWSEGELAVMELVVPDSRDYEFEVYAKPKIDPNRNYTGILHYVLPRHAPAPMPEPGLPLAAGQDFSEIDRHALAAPRAAAQSPERLAAYLSLQAKTDLEKTRAIFRWLTANIAYDTEAYFSNTIRSDSPEDTLRLGMGVCAGYAGLFVDLARRMNLKARKVSGYSKGYSHRRGETMKVNHAWNVVSLDGKWYLIDATWGAGYLSGREFKRGLEEGYFLTPPQWFAYSHLPEDSRWQLLPEPLSLPAFADRVKLKPRFFLAGLIPGAYEQAVIRSGETIAVSISNPRQVRLLATLKNSHGPVNLTPDVQGAQTILRGKVAAPGGYELDIFADDGTKSYQHVATYDVQVTSGR